MKTVYLVDVENVGSSWSKLLSNMRENDKIYLFTSTCSDCSCNLSFKMSDLTQIKKAFSRMTVIPVLNGTSHSLDFQLVSFLGYLLRTDKQSEYVILSNDRGYDLTCEFWNERGASVKRLQTKKGGNQSEDLSERGNGKNLSQFELVELNSEKDSSFSKDNLDDLDEEEIFLSIPREEKEKKQTVQAVCTPSQKSRKKPDQNFSFTPARCAGDIPSDVMNKLRNTLEKKNRTNENLVLMYNAVVSGSNEKMREAALRIVGSAKATAIYKHWKSLCPKIQSMVREDEKKRQGNLLLVG